MLGLASRSGSSGKVVPLVTRPPASLFVFPRFDSSVLTRVEPCFAWVGFLSSLVRPEPPSLVLPLFSRNGLSIVTQIRESVRDLLRQ